MTTKRIQCPVCYGEKLIEENDTLRNCHHCSGKGYIEEEWSDEIYPRLQAKIDVAIAEGKRTISVSWDDADLMKKAGYLQDKAGTKIMVELGHPGASMFVNKPEQSIDYSADDGSCNRSAADITPDPAGDAVTAEPVVGFMRPCEHCSGTGSWDDGWHTRTCTFCMGTGIYEPDDVDNWTTDDLAANL